MDLEENKTEELGDANAELLARLRKQATDIVETPRQKFKPGSMETGKCRVKFDKVGNDVEVKGITPAEVQVLRKMHQVNVGGDPVHALEVNENAPAAVRIGVEEDGSPKLRERTANEEVRRLVHKYGKKLIDSMFPGENKVLPATFKEVKEMPSVSQANDKADEDLGILSYHQD